MSKFGGELVIQKPISKFGGEPIEEPKEKTLFNLPESIAKTVFPSTYKSKEGEIRPKKAVVSALEALSLPLRLGGAVATKKPWSLPAEYEKGYKITDPQSMYFRPETEILKKKIEKDIYKLPYTRFESTLPRTPEQIAKGEKITKQFDRGVVEMLGTIASDPTLIGGFLKGMVKGVGKGSVKKTISKELEKEAKEIISPEELIQSAAPKKQFLSRLSQSDRSILREPLTKYDTPFEVYADVAKKAVTNPRNPTPLDVAGRKAVKALNSVSELRKKVGATKGALVDANKGARIDITDLKKQWSDLLNERQNAVVVDGKVVNSFNIKNPINKPSESGMIVQIDNIINNLDDEIFVKEADNIKMAVQDIVNNFKATQAKPINTITEGMGKELVKTVDNKLVNVLGAEFKNINTEYRNLKNIEQFLSRKVGPLMKAGGVDQAERGASLLKSSLQSNSDRNTRLLFENIKDITGIDLVKDAKFAEIAMRSVDDPRIRGLLEEVGAIRKMIPGKTGTILQAINEVAGKVRKPVIEEARKEALKDAWKSQEGFYKTLKPIKKNITFKGTPAASQIILDLINKQTEGE